MARFAEARRIRPFCLKFVSACWVLCGFISWQLHRDARFQRQVHAGWLCLFTCSFDMVIVALSICEQLSTSITAFSIQHLRFVSTLLTNERTNQPSRHSLLKSQSKNSPNFWNPKIYYRVHKSTPLVPFGSQINPLASLSLFFEEPY